MSEREKTRARNKKKEAERRKKLNRQIIISLLLMYIALLAKGSFAHSWVLMIPTTIYCFAWSFANTDQHHKKRRRA